MLLFCLNRLRASLNDSFAHASLASAATLRGALSSVTARRQSRAARLRALRCAAPSAAARGQKCAPRRKNHVAENKRMRTTTRHQFQSMERVCSSSAITNIERTNEQTSRNGKNVFWKGRETLDSLRG
ncbi:MAG: hypothetical protein AB7O62_06205 [Pirellulales bacterium]